MPGPVATPPPRLVVPGALLALLALRTFLALAASQDAAPPVMRAADLARLPQPPADRVVAYGAAPQQVAELRVPRGPGPHPVAILVHGGCWQARWSLDHVRALAAAFAQDGVATWSLEYRRVGDPGGGWPGTLADVARGADHLRVVAEAERLDLARVVAVGHSAGGQLALWLGARARLKRGSPLWSDAPLSLRGVVSLAGITDLRAAAEGRVCDDAVAQLLGGPPAAHEERVRDASPIELLPLGLPQRLVCGAHDTLVPNDLSTRYAEAARKAGDPVAMEVAEAGHFELVDPASGAWPSVRRAFAELLR
jgi:acetyl esterase/lipase